MDNIPFSQMAARDLLDAFAAAEPVPGGGSAAALAGALGVSLLLMVATMTRTRTGAPEETADLAEAAARLRPLRDALTDLIDEDSDAYAAVARALKLPKQTPEEQARRRDALQAASIGATAVPLQTMRVCQQALRGSVAVARQGNRSAASDVGVAIELLIAALRGAGLNVDTNVASIRDEAFVARSREERAALERDAVDDAATARAALSA